MILEFYVRDNPTIYKPHKHINIFLIMTNNAHTNDYMQRGEQDIATTKHKNEIA